MNKLKILSTKTIIFIAFIIFLIISVFIKFTPGIEIANNFKSFSFEMLKVLPPIFILIGLFDVWVKRETIVKHLGKNGGIKSFFWVFILAAPMAGGLLPAFPVAHSLYKKGARLTVILVFLGAVGIGRVPMILFESTFLGIKYSAIRIIASIPLVLIFGILLGRLLEKHNYALPKNDK
ncbi:permease [Helicovermis profundi]|uniref:Permease n=1 Tax=Helicovermis profundi TaxID=3065157 RepID=A0AAU9EIX3_9FIRM|nr:permease [Clostridia bacterium S502]